MSYRVCVASGYPMRHGANVEAEALVYTFGGQVVARFVRGGNSKLHGKRGATEEWKRARVRAQADEWVAGHAA